MLEETVDVLEKDVETKTDTVFVTSLGVKIKYRGVSPFKLEKVKSSVVIPKPPTYEVKTALGKTEVFYLDDVSVDQVENGHAMWATYIQNKQDKLAEQNDKAMRAIFVGCRILDWGDTAGWEADNAFLGLAVPEDPREKELYYMMNELQGNEIVDLMNLIMKLSGASEEDIKKAEDTFRG